MFQHHFEKLQWQIKCFEIKYAAYEMLQFPWVNKFPAWINFGSPTQLEHSAANDFFSLDCFSFIFALETKLWLTDKIFIHP